MKDNTSSEQAEPLNFQAALNTTLDLIGFFTNCSYLVQNPFVHSFTPFLPMSCPLILLGMVSCVDRADWNYSHMLWLTSLGLLLT